VAQGERGAAPAGVLAVRAGPLHPATLRTAGCLLLLVATVLLLRGRPGTLWQKLRLACAYPVTLGLYGVTALVAPALGLPLWDEALLALDEALVGTTPALALEPLVHPWATEVLSACYLSYHLYLHGMLLAALLGPLEVARRLAAPLFTTFALGYAGYVLVPAVGPVVSMAPRFQTPLAGGPITTAWVVAQGGAVYDVLPSLHVPITCVLLAHDAREAPRRFRLMLPVAPGLLISTVYLRYHYLVDLVAALLLFGAVEAVRRRRMGERPQSALALTAARGGTTSR
jgi:hypothetical protein